NISKANGMRRHHDTHWRTRSSRTAMMSDLSSPARIDAHGDQISEEITQAIRQCGDEDNALDSVVIPCFNGLYRIRSEAVPAVNVLHEHGAADEVAKRSRQHGQTGADR